jgi:hypothetical protein
VRPEAGWTGWIPEVERIVADDGVMGDRTGASVAFLGETIIVSAPFSDIAPNVDQGRVLIFAPGRPDHTLTVQVTGPGTVDSSPSGLVCSFDECSEMFADGTVIRLDTFPRVDAEFAGWSGDADCSDGNVTLNADTTCIATFVEKPELDIRIDHAIGGHVTIDPPGIECNQSCIREYSPGTLIRLTATPHPDYEFSGWSGSPGCADEITLDSDMTCIATFTPIPLEDLDVWIEGDGRVTSVPAGMNCSTRCNELFVRGTSITLTATPDAGWAFSGWEGDADCSDGQITLNDDVFCVARFNRLPDLTGQWTNVGSWCPQPFWRPNVCLVWGMFHLINRSSVEVAATTIRFLLSADAVADNHDIVLGVRRLRAPGGPRQVGFAMFLPPGVRPDGLRLLTVVDPNNEIAEYDEGNNLVTAAPF